VAAALLDEHKSLPAKKIDFAPLYFARSGLLQLINGIITATWNMYELTASAADKHLRISTICELLESSVFGHVIADLDGTGVSSQARKSCRQMPFSVADGAVDQQAQYWALECLDGLNLMMQDSTVRVRRILVSIADPVAARIEHRR
jgi:hypothetical protein